MHKTTEIQTSYRFLKSYFLKKKKKTFGLVGWGGGTEPEKERQADRQTQTDRQTTQKNGSLCKLDFIGLLVFPPSERGWEGQQASMVTVVPARTLLC